MGVGVSVVIPAYNAEKIIGKTLNSLKKMRFGTVHEIIVVDDGSSDSTKEIVKSFKDVNLICQLRKGPGAARNIGIKKAKGRFIYFLDSDCEVTRNTLQMLYNHIIENEKIGAVGGSIELPNHDQNLLARADHFCSWYHHNPGMKSGIVRSTPTANLLVRKEVFDKVALFKTGVTSGEDVDFGINLRNAGYEFHALNSAFVYHYNRTNLKSFIRHSMKWGYNGPLIRGKNKDAKFHYLFPDNIFLAIIYFLPCFIAQSLYVEYVWLKCRNFKSILYSPFIALRCFLYQAGVIVGTYDLRKAENLRSNIY